MLRRVGKLSIVCVALVGLLCGCSTIGLGVETQLIPPENNGEQTAIRNALDEYIQTNTGSGESEEYTLKYPSGGQYLSAFIMLDQVQEHTLLGEKAPESDVKALENMALAFYRRNYDEALVHINLLQRSEDGLWVSIADVEGKGQSVDQVEFADLNNDAIPELLIGWQLYNTRDMRLAIYDVDKDLAEREFSRAYTNLVVADVTADGADDLLLFSTTVSPRATSVEMFSFQTDNIITHGQTQLDDNIVRFGGHIAAPLTSGINGVFVDCYKENEAMITELITWKDGKLLAPLCDEETKINFVTARETALASRDIDGDGVVEWPVTSRMAGFEDSAVDKTLWYTEWQSYDVNTDMVQTKFTSLIPPPDDGYMLRLRDSWETLPVAYNSATRTLTLYRDADSGEWLFRIGVFALEEKDSLPEGFVLLEETEQLCYAIWVSDTSDAVSIEEFHYLLNIF